MSRQVDTTYFFGRSFLDKVVSHERCNRGWHTYFNQVVNTLCIAAEMELV